MLRRYSHLSKKKVPINVMVPPGTVDAIDVIVAIEEESMIIKREGVE